MDLLWKDEGAKIRKEQKHVGCSYWLKVSAVNAMITLLINFISKKYYYNSYIELNIVNFYNTDTDIDTEH